MIEMRLTDLIPFYRPRTQEAHEGERVKADAAEARKEALTVLHEARQRMAVVRRLVQADEIAPLPRIWDDGGPT